MTEATLSGWQFAALVVSLVVGVLTASSIFGSAFWVIARTTINTQNMTKAIDQLRDELKHHNETQQEHASRLARIEAKIERVVG